MNGICVSDAAGECDAVKQRGQLSAVSGNVADADDKMTSTADADVVNDDQAIDADNDDDEDEEKIPDWIRCSPADLFFKRDSVCIDC